MSHWKKPILRVRVILVDNIGTHTMQDRPQGSRLCPNFTFGGLRFLISQHQYANHRTASSDPIRHHFVSSSIPPRHSAYLADTGNDMSDHEYVWLAESRVPKTSPCLPAALDGLSKVKARTMIPCANAWSVSTEWTARVRCPCHNLDAYHVCIIHGVPSRRARDNE